MIYSNAFRMMAQEGHLASTSLLAGFENINKIHYDKPGTVYSALFQLATGFERIMKVALILDHKVRHDLNNPTDKQLKAFGHSVSGLYDTLAKAHPSIDGWVATDSLHNEFLLVVSEFARGSRYYNIDQLVSGAKNPDPLVRWAGLHLDIARHYFSYKKISGVMDRARKHCERFGQFGYEMGLRGEYDLTIDVTFEMEIARLSRGHCVWVAIETLKPVCALIEKLCGQIHKMEIQMGHANPTVPFMAEFFPFGMTERQTAIRRKAWSSLFFIAGRV
ncbi:hypothetical protein ELG79_36610 [Rhizobium leguminosarum]|uniref:hypothetical protein n=1 Tax=Rhizobium leguminosarum TaxID=384 RepID=UPI0010312A45|nr:hypothetical protein [Rhizobium leguminosarum]TBG08445.1 hypothetical protein ELG79_36610 [Rhizobium leguminosarum]